MPICIHPSEFLANLSSTASHKTRKRCQDIHNEESRKRGKDGLTFSRFPSFLIFADEPAQSSLRLRNPLRPERAHDFARFPHFTGGDFLQLLFELFAIVGPAVGVEDPLGFFAALDALVE